VDVRFFRACHQFAFYLDLDFGDAASETIWSKSGAKLLVACLIQSFDMQLTFQSFFPRNLFPENSTVNQFCKEVLAVFRGLGSVGFEILPCLSECRVSLF
jgi:hypothetical protein